MYVWCYSYATNQEYVDAVDWAGSGACPAGAFEGGRIVWALSGQAVSEKNKTVIMVSKIIMSINIHNRPKYI